MRRSRAFLITCFASAGCLLALAIVAAVYVLNPPLPSPAESNREEIVRWLVTRDLGRESTETRQILARRLEEEFGSGVDWETTGSQLNENQRQQLWDNVVLLLKPWFLEKTQRYFQLAASDRTAFLDELLDTVSMWQEIDTLYEQAPDSEVATQQAAAIPGDTPQPAAQQQGLVNAFFGQVEKCKEEAEPEDRQKIDEFLMAVQGRWLVRSMTQW